MINRILLLLLTILLLSSYSIVVTKETDNLRMTISILDLSYCRSPIHENDFDVFIKLQLTYMNIGKKPLILETEPNFITSWRIKPNLKELESSGYTDILGAFSDNEGVTETGDVPSANFIVLQPGEAYRSETDMKIHNAKLMMEEKVITTGSQYLQIIIPKWSGNKKQASFLKGKWKKDWCTVHRLCSFTAIAVYD